ncbi:interleukin-1 beta [Menidia menidia]
MADFHLSQALEGSPELESSCFDMKDEQPETLSIDQNLELVVSRDRRTMRRVASLVLVVNRMIRPSTEGPESLQDFQICSLILDHMVEENIVKTDTNWSAGQKRRRFLPVSSGRQFTLSDLSQKDVILNSDQFLLQAVTLKAGNCSFKTNFKMSTYVPSPYLRCDGQMVALSLLNDLYMSCDKAEDRVLLKLEHISKERIENEEDTERLLFLRRTSGISMNTFESVKYRGWFMSTSREDQKPLEMCERDSACRITAFKVHC